MKLCTVCGLNKPLTEFAEKRAQCKACYKILNRNRYMGKKNRVRETSSYISHKRRLANPYSSQSVLLMGDVIPCARCGEPVERRAMWKHLKGHRR